MKGIAKIIGGTGVALLLLLLTITSQAQQAPLVISTIGRAVQVAVTPTVTASSAYSSGNVIGGVMTFPVFRGNGGKSGVMTSCIVLDRANQKPALTVLFFNHLPTGTYTDKAAFSFDSTDAVYLVRSVSIATTDYVTCGSYAVADIGAIGKAVFTDESESSALKNNVYAVMVTTSTPTFNAATNVTVKVGVIQD